MTSLNTVSAEFPWPKEGTQNFTSDDAVAFTCNFNQVIANDGNLNTKIFLDNTDKSSTYLSGSTTVDSTGYAVTTKTLAAAIPAGTYVLEVYGSVGGQVRMVGALKLVIRAHGDL